MKNDDNFKLYFKLARLYTTHTLSHQGVIALSAEQAHYLHNVMRHKQGDKVRLFNGKDGEWGGTLSEIDKKSATVTLEQQLRVQPQSQRRIHALFCPIKKHRMDIMIEKAVELGVTDFHPVLSQNTEVRKINGPRVTQQIFEAAEQCERLEIPALHEIEKIENKITQWPQETKLLACIERFDAQPITDLEIKNDQDIAFLIGPEGGFTALEKELLIHHGTAIDLGETILRTETALIKTLILLNP